MNYWQARDALARLGEFRALLLDLGRAYSDRASGGISSPVANRTRKRMARLSAAVQEDLEHVGMGRWLYTDPLLLGRKEHENPIAYLAVSASVWERFVGDKWPDVVLALDVAIGEYERIAERERRNLYNPLWWLRQLIGLLFRLPFYLLGELGYDRREAERSRAAEVWRRIYGGCFSLVAVLAGIVTILSGLRAFGWLDAIESAIPFP